MSNSYIRRKKVRTLIPLLLILLSSASFSAAQEKSGSDARLIARADTRETSVSYDIRSAETFRNDTVKTAPALSEDETAGISRAVREELDSQRNSGLSYSPPSINLEDLPLVMSTTDRKTVSVVVPPFLYFKTQF